jgi:hypothetical protein
LKDLVFTKVERRQNHLNELLNSVSGHTYVYRTDVQCLRIFVMQSRTTVIRSYLKTSVFISYYSRCFFIVHFFLPSSIHTFIPERNCTPLECFYKGCVRSNQQLALSRLMHSIYTGSVIFPYQALERRSAQETLVGFAGLHNTENSKAFDIHSVDRWLANGFKNYFTGHKFTVLIVNTSNNKLDTKRIVLFVGVNLS